jgi:hypothetical protein
MGWGIGGIKKGFCRSTDLPQVLSSAIERQISTGALKLYRVKDLYRLIKLLGKTCNGETQHQSGRKKIFHCGA